MVLRRERLSRGYQPLLASEELPPTRKQHLDRCRLPCWITEPLCDTTARAERQTWHWIFDAPEFFAGVEGRALKRHETWFISLGPL